MLTFPNIMALISVARCVHQYLREHMNPQSFVGQLVRFMFKSIDVCIHRSLIAHVILIPVVRSGWSAIQTERKLDDDHKPGECFNWSNL